MNWFFFLVFGIISGVFAGMGMGGGTFLIPLLTIFLSVGQLNAQAINLVVFVPTAILVGTIYFFSGYVDWKRVLFVAIPATAVSVLAAFVAFGVSPVALRRIFGAFIMIVGVSQLLREVLKKGKAEN